VNVGIGSCGDCLRKCWLRNSGQQSENRGAFKTATTSPSDYPAGIWTRSVVPAPSHRRLTPTHGAVILDRLRPVSDSRRTERVCRIPSIGAPIPASSQPHRKGAVAQPRPADEPVRRPRGRSWSARPSTAACRRRPGTRRAAPRPGAGGAATCTCIGIGGAAGSAAHAITGAMNQPMTVHPVRKVRWRQSSTSAGSQRPPTAACSRP
jgi:hypothetical protein